MANKRWKGGAPSIAQVDTVTVGGAPAAGQIYTVTIGGESVSYTASGMDTINTIASALQALLTASQLGEFQDCTWTVNAKVITSTAVLAGQPFILTASASGTGTLTDATTTINSGPNDIAVAGNWDVGAVPVAGDILFLDGNGYDLWYNLQLLAGVTLAARYISSTFQPDSNGNATIGLPETNTNGSTPYAEYRQRYWQAGVTTDYIGFGSGNGSGQILLDYGAVQTSCVVYNTGSPTGNNQAILIKGTNALNSFSILHGYVALGPTGDDITEANTLTLGTSRGGVPNLTCGQSCTVTSCILFDGVVQFANAPGTLTHSGGTSVILAGNTTITQRGGVTLYDGKGSIAVTITSGGSVDLSRSTEPCTVTSATLYKGATLIDPNHRVTWTNPITLSQCGLADVELDFGKNITLNPVYL